MSTKRKIDEVDNQSSSFDEIPISNSNSVAISSSSTFTLTVGDKSFVTKKDTLMKGSRYFEVLLSGRFGDADIETTSFFIDRDPTVFHILLNYMRSNHLYIESSSIHLLSHIIIDAENMISILIYSINEIEHKLVQE